MLVKYEQNPMVRTMRKKMINHFWQSIDATLEDVSVTETILLFDAELKSGFP